MAFPEPKPFASLSSGLLARKGQARPAMRPQGFVGMTPESIEDLGWNDMGDAPVATGLTPAPMPAKETAKAPPVLRDRERLAEQFDQAEQVPSPHVADSQGAAREAAAAPEAAAVVATDTPAHVAPPVTGEQRGSVSLNTAKRLRKETNKKRGKAAFTLRLDSDRHLRLRLASAVRGDSAQALVTEALDRFLEQLPEVDALVRQLDDAKGR